MNILEGEKIVAAPVASPHLKMRMLQQMAEALEDEAAGLYRRVASIEEEGFLLSREIEERQTEVNRLQFKLEALRSDRDGLAGRIEDLRTEAAEIRGVIEENEDALARSHSAMKSHPAEAAGCGRPQTGAAREGLFFQKIILPQDL